MILSGLDASVRPGRGVVMVVGGNADVNMNGLCGL